MGCQYSSTPHSLPHGQLHGGTTTAPAFAAAFAPGAWDKATGARIQAKRVKDARRRGEELGPTLHTGFKEDSVESRFKLEDFALLREVSA